MAALTLSDTMLCELLKDLLEWSGRKRDEGMTTGRAADQLRRVWKDQQSKWKVNPQTDLFGMVLWLDAVRDASKARNAVVHAAAKARCRYCGRAEGYRHAKSGTENVDRSPGALRDLTYRMDRLIEQGLDIARIWAKSRFEPSPMTGWNVCPDCNPDNDLWQVHTEQPLVPGGPSLRFSGESLP